MGLGSWCVYNIEIPFSSFCNVNWIFKKFTILKLKRLKEVPSKISILLETTGGILFSPEGFEKMLFAI